MLIFIHIMAFLVVIYFTAGVYYWSWMINDMKARRLPIWKMFFILTFFAFPYAMAMKKNYNEELKARGLLK